MKRVPHGIPHIQQIVWLSTDKLESYVLHNGWSYRWDDIYNAHCYGYDDDKHVIWGITATKDAPNYKTKHAIDSILDLLRADTPSSS